MWNKIVDKMPEEDGMYLVLRKVGKGKGYIDIQRYTNNLYKLNKHDFWNEKGKGGGFVGFSDEFGYFKAKDVVAWMELPEIPEEWR